MHQFIEFIIFPDVNSVKNFLFNNTVAGLVIMDDGHHQQVTGKSSYSCLFTSSKHH